MDVVSAITAAASLTSVHASLLLALCHVESRHLNGISPADGHSASYGICQVKLGTARMIDPTVRPTYLLNPEVNAYFAARILERHIRRYGGNVCRALVAYNRGSAPKRFDNRDNWCNNRYSKKVMKALTTEPWKGAENE